MTSNDTLTKRNTPGLRFHHRTFGTMTVVHSNRLAVGQGHVMAVTTSGRKIPVRKSEMFPVESAV